MCSFTFGSKFLSLCELCGLSIMPHILVSRPSLSNCNDGGNVGTVMLSMGTSTSSRRLDGTQLFKATEFMITYLPEWELHSLSDRYRQPSCTHYSEASMTVLGNPEPGPEKKISERNDQETWRAIMCPGYVFRLVRNTRGSFLLITQDTTQQVAVLRYLQIVQLIF